MWPMLLPLIGSLIPPLINSWTTNTTNQQNQQFTEQTNLQNQAFQREMNLENQRWDASKIQRLVEDARKAGIHPLAALGSSASGAMAQSVAPTFQAPQHASPPPMGDAVADAFGQLAGILTLRKQKLEGDLMAEQVKAARSRTAIAAARAATIGGPGSASGEFVIEPQRTSHIRPPFMIPHIPSGGTSDSQSVEDRYGDVVENVYGIGNLLWDLGNMVPWSETFKPGQRNYSRWRQ